MTEDQAQHYLAAMIDGEGHVTLNHPRLIAISNTDWDIIEAVAQCCQVLGLRHRVEVSQRPKNGWKTCWRVVIVGKMAIIYVRDHVPVRCRRKAARIEEISHMFKRSCIVRPTREFLEEQYWANGLTLGEIAKLVGVAGGGSVLPWFREYGIPTRQNGEAQFNYHQRRVQALEEG